MLSAELEKMYPDTWYETDPIQLTYEGEVLVERHSGFFGRHKKSTPPPVAPLLALPIMPKSGQLHCFPQNAVDI